MMNILRKLIACAIMMTLLALTGAPASVKAEEGEASRVVIRCLGDFIIHDPLLQAAQTADGGYDFYQMIAPVADLIADADFTVANVDGTIGASDVYTGYPRFNSPVALLDALQEAGVDMLTLANNHALDSDYEGLITQMNLLDARGMAHIGTARTQEESDTPYVREINGIRIGFLNYTTHANGRENSCGKDAATFGLNLVFKNADFEGDAQALRDAGAEVIVAFMHWGTEYDRTEHEEQRVLTTRLARAGVDIVVGGHPHAIQRINWREATRTHDGGKQRTLVCYSRGNFLSNQQSRYQNCGIIFEFTLEKDENGNITVQSPGYIPVFVWREELKNGYSYQVLASERALNNAPEGMSKEVLSWIRTSWNDTISHLSTKSSAADCIHVE